MGATMLEAAAAAVFLVVITVLTSGLGLRVPRR
jgi:hypothetical protein